MVPSTRLWLTLCLLAIPGMAAGFFAGFWPWILLFDGLGLAAAIADFALARRARLAVRRVLPPRLQVGIPNTVSLSVENRGGTAVRATLKDDAPEAFATSPATSSFTAPAGRRITLRYHATPSRRGRFEFGDLHLRVEGPLGLVAHERHLPAAATASVFPDMRQASRLLLADAALDWVNLGLRQLRRDGQGSEFARLRDYAQGDSVREVDWKATARRSRPVTRVAEAERSQAVLIGVDAGRSMAARAGEVTKLDHAINAALFLAFVAVRNGDRVGLVVFADGIKAYLQPATGRAQYRKIVDVLYAARPSLTSVDYHALFKELHGRLRKRSLLCLFTDFVDEDQAETMVEPLRLLAARHLLACLSIKDAALHQLLRTPPPDTEGAFHQAVASELLLEREAVKRRIGRGGVAVVDVEAEALSIAAVNQYLEVKSRGSL